MWSRISVSRSLSAKISLLVVLVSVPCLAVAVWRAAEAERAEIREQLLDRGRVAAVSGAATFSAVLEAGVAAGVLKVEDLTDPIYERIVFPAAPSVDDRFHTQFDAYTDTHGIQAVEDAILASSDSFVFATGIDARGYVPTPHARYAEPPTGDPAHDKARSRGKRKYTQDEPLTAAWFDGPGTIVLPYHRDTGEEIWDVVAPIRVKGKHFGAFRVEVRQDQVSAKSAALAADLARLLGAAALLVVLVVFLAVRRATRPLVQLAARATELSTTHDGSGLEAPIRATSRDEVGQMAKALDRLRQSLRVVWRGES